MSKRSEYQLNFGHLPLGESEFEFSVNQAFFDAFENDKVSEATADILLVVDKKPNMLLMDFTITGEVTLPCDRCLETLILDLEGYNEVIVKFGEQADVEETDEAEIITLPSGDTEMDLAQLIYEYICLLIPFRNVHADDENGNSTCNAEVMKKLNEHKVKEDHNDPRWNDLKNINLN